VPTAPPAAHAVATPLFRRTDPALSARRADVVDAMAGILRRLVAGPEELITKGRVRIRRLACAGCKRLIWVVVGPARCSDWPGAAHRAGAADSNRRHPRSRLNTDRQHLPVIGRDVQLDLLPSRPCRRGSFGGIPQPAQWECGELRAEWCRFGSGTEQAPRSGSGHRAVRRGIAGPSDRRCAGCRFALTWIPTMRPSGCSLRRSTSTPLRSRKCQSVEKLCDKLSCRTSSVATSVSSSGPSWVCGRANPGAVTPWRCAPSPTSAIMSAGQHTIAHRTKPTADPSKDPPPIRPNPAAPVPVGAGAGHPVVGAEDEAAGAVLAVVALPGDPIRRRGVGDRRAGVR